MITILVTRNTGLPFRETDGSIRSISSVKDTAKTLLLRRGLRTMGMGSYADLFTPDMLEHTPDGKPFLADLPDIHFNLSHSGDYIACAFSDREIGLDLQEHSRTRISILRIAGRFFSPEEHAAVLALPPDEKEINPDNSACRLPFFYRLWSIKEAYLKYLGCGLRGGMDGYCPDPLPPAEYPESSSPGNPSAQLPPMTGAGDGACEKSAPKAPSLQDAIEPVLGRGRIRILRQDPLLAPAEYALLQAPENYTLAVCAARLPGEITIQYI